MDKFNLNVMQKNHLIDYITILQFFCNTKNLFTEISSYSK